MPVPPPIPGPPFDARDLSVLRVQVAAVRAASQRAGTFRGFRSVTVGFSALAAVVTAVADAVQREPKRIYGPIRVLYDPDLWQPVAALCLAVAGGEMLWRSRRSGYGLAMTWTAAGQFLPCVAAGALVTVSATTFSKTLVPYLPGLWATLFGLGVCSCARLLPRPFWAVGAWYLLAGQVGLIAPAVGGGDWFLGVTFGAGQAVTAGLLYLLVERPERLAGRPEGWGEEDPAPAPNASAGEPRAA